MSRLGIWGGIALVAAVLAAMSVEPSAPAAFGATCDDHPSQASAQRAKDTRDADGDGIYCETLPCPCLPPDPRADPDNGGAPRGGSDDEKSGDGCRRPRRMQRLVFEKDDYPNIRRHVRRAVRRGWPRRLVINRRGADQRRDKLLDHYPTREGYDRDEYPPSVGRGRGKGLKRGRNPRGWKASVRYVPSSENRSHGAVLGSLLEGFCSGTRFRYVFR